MMMVMLFHTFGSPHHKEIGFLLFPDLLLSLNLHIVIKLPLQFQVVFLFFGLFDCSASSISLDLHLQLLSVFVLLLMLIHFLVGVSLVQPSLEITGKGNIVVQID